MLQKLNLKQKNTVWSRLYLQRFFLNNLSFLFKKPLKSFRPPFCIDPVKFEFTPRVQRLNEIDALFRLRIIFINKLVKFWQIHGQHFRIPWAENKYIDLYKLQKVLYLNFLN